VIDLERLEAHLDLALTDELFQDLGLSEGRNVFDQAS